MSCRGRLRGALTVGAISMLVCGAPAGVIDPSLQELLNKSAPGEPVSVLVFLQARVDLTGVTHDLDARRAPLKERHEVVVRALQDKAASQGDLKAHLQDRRAAGAVQDFKEFWIANAIRVDAHPAEIFAIAQRPDVERVYINYAIESIKPIEQQPSDGPVQVAAEPGVIAVRAPEVWALGITGTGVLVATLGTGVDGNHPALASRWRGLDPAYAGHPQWAWFDPVTNTTFPQSFGSSGTHTMGTVCGGPPGDQVGVAPGAQWIHAAVIDRVSIHQTISDAILAFQWLIDPDGNPATDFDVPASCSNSWGLADFHGIPDCDQTFWSFIDACEAAGIVLVFSAGDEGPPRNSLRRPADRATDAWRNLAVAAVDANVPGWPVASFSSRGPTFCTPGGAMATKPDISAPGVNVRSSLPGGSYGLMTSTAISCPHINGVVALIRQANPDLAVPQVKQIIYDTAHNLGPPGEDNDFGWGMVDAFEAVQAAHAVTFAFPDGRPELIDPNGGTTIHVVTNNHGDAAVPDSAALHYSDGGPFISTPMVQTGPGDYLAVFPAFACGSVVQYYFSVLGESGTTYVDPFTAPASTYSGVAYSGFSYPFQDNFETDQGWSVTNSPTLTTGTWQRGIPVNCNRGDPPADHDGSGQCYLTFNSSANACDSDVDNGSTTLTSPVMDASDAGSMLRYSRWYSNTFGASPNQDIFVVEVSANGGTTWSNLETVGPAGPEVSGGWIQKEFPVSTIPGIGSTSQLRIRFTASDTNPQSIVEAAVDAVEIFVPFCACPADLDGDGSVGDQDFQSLLDAWGPNPGNPADLDGDGIVGITDFLALLATWGPCP